jgi:hypothetical protein
MVLVHPGDKASYEGGKMPDKALVDGMMKFNEELQKAGVLLALDGLHPTSKGALVAHRGGKKNVTTGPFTEATELIGGFWLWQCKSKEEAIEWAKRAPMEDGAVLELRQVFDIADFGPDIANDPVTKRVQAGLEKR